MKRIFVCVMFIAFVAVLAFPSVGFSGGYHGRPGYYYGHHGSNWVPAAIGGFLFGTLLGSAAAQPVYYAPPPPPPPPRVYYYYPPPRPRVYVYPY